MLMEAKISESGTAPHNPFRSYTSAPRGLTALMHLHKRALELEASHEADSGECPVSPSILRDLLSSLQFRDGNTFEHSRRVSLIAVGLAKQLCWNASAIQELELASMLHDIGKIGIPDHILYKPGNLTMEEASLMGLRTVIAEDILEICRVPKRIRDVIVESRTPYSGLEDYLRPVGKELSQPGRLLAVVDAFESLTRDQVYRSAMSIDQVFEHLNEEAGKLYDAGMVQSLHRWLKSGGQEMLDRYGAKSQNNLANNSAGASLALSSLCNVFTYLFSIEQTYKGFVLTDIQGTILMANRGCRELYNCQDEDLKGVDWKASRFPQANVYEQWLPQEQLPLRKVLETQEAETSTVKVRSAEKEWIELEVQSIPLFDDGGELIGASEFYRVKDQNLVESAQYKQLALQASRDALTGVANRGTLESQLSRVMTTYRDNPDDNLFSVIYLDIDHFKSINDTFGHATGDEVLVNLAKLLREETYTSEFVARYGGEEFVVICSELGANQAAKRAERFREVISKLTFDSAPSLKITSSFGVSQVEAGDCLESVLKRADTALYQSKNNGRNRTTVLMRTESSHESESEAKAKASTSSHPYRFENDLSGVLFDDFLILKLHGFVEKVEGKLLSVKKGQVTIQVGKKSFWGSWGHHPDKQPVLMKIDASSVIESRGNRSQSQKIAVEIRPIGKAGKPERFQKRAKAVFRDLREHFMTQQ